MAYVSNTTNKYTCSQIFFIVRYILVVDVTTYGFRKIVTLAKNLVIVLRKKTAAPSRLQCNLMVHVSYTLAAS